MPENKDLKRLIRRRMSKTGESYTAARAQILKKPMKKPVRPAAGSSPSLIDYAKLAGKSDEAVVAKTGSAWDRWVRELDQVGAAKMTHREIARLVHERGISDWWAQTVTVGYERIRGLREIGQRRDGSYEVTKSKTVAVPVDKLYRAFADERMRRRWLPAQLEIRSSTRSKTVRIAWEDGTRVEVGFTAKGANKAQVAIQHRKLKDKGSIACLKAYWAERLTALSELLEAD